MRIHYVIPWKTGDIGGGINEAIAAIDPGRDDWICVRDGDTMFLTGRWGQLIQAIVDANKDYELIGCLTNRVRAAYQLYGGDFSEEADIGKHLAIAQQCELDHKSFVKPVPTGPIAGMFMLFPRRVWEREPFAVRSIYFDQEFTAAVRRAGGKVGVAWGIYLFHLYRWGQVDPFGYKDHLL